MPCATCAQSVQPWLALQALLELSVASPASLQSTQVSSPPDLGAIAFQELPHTVCRDCRNWLRREETRLSREKDAHRYAQRVNRLAAAEKTVQLLTVTAQMIERFGGLDELVRTWKRAIDAAEEKGKDHLVCRSMTAIMHLVVACTSLQVSVTQPDMVDDEDLRREFEAVTARVIVSHPELAIRAARQLGWTIIPPDNNANDGRSVP